MHRRFNTAGPNDPEDHHTLPVLARLLDVRRRIDEKLYFVLHAPRHAGKTTALLALARELTSEGRYTAVVLPMESGAPFREQVGMAEDAILDAWQAAASRRLPPELQPPAWPSAPPGHRISRALQVWAEQAPRPLVVLLDDTDTLEDVALVSMLRQLRDGFPDRPHHFPWSLILTGRRDVPDYKLAPGSGGHAGTESPFDVRSDPLTLDDFSHDGIAALYRQHTEDTGQVFLPVAIDRAFRLTRGQPWLVNALARQLVEVVVPDRTTAITAAHVEAARALLVQRKEAHFDCLAEQLQEPRLRAILAPMLRGEALGDVPEEDRRLALDLGLVRSSEAGALAIANPLYREVLVRLLASGRRAAPPQLTATWIPAEGLLDEEEAPAEAELVLEVAPLHPITPSRAPVRALARVARAPLESFPPEELTEWFRPVSKVRAQAVGKRPPAPPKADSAGDAARARRDRQGLAALVGAGCVLAATLVWFVSSGERPAEATPAPGSSNAASVEAFAAAPHSATAVASLSARLAPEARDAPRASGDPSASRASAPGTSARAPVRAWKHAALVASESRVVPALPTLPPPDEARMRRELEPRVWGGEASIEEIRMLKAICSSTGDRGCRDRAAEMLLRREP